MFIDSATIFVRSGKGGDGRVSFRREKYIPKGGPDGGDGGDGGSVVFIATAGVDTLLDFKGRHHYHAQDGGAGGSRQCTGRNAEDLEVRLPPGTLIYNDETGNLINDLDKPGKRLVVVRGGKGGYGNEHFKTSTNQAPRQCMPGQSGQELSIRLELKLIADVGLVGKPNAGKSTLLSRVSKARPKIADYPFTTLEPHLGIAELAVDHGPRSPRGSRNPRGGELRRLVVADIPGLIEGAHLGQGLGTRFLRHVERTRLLVHLLEAQPADGSEPVDNYRTVRRELDNYSPALAEKPELIVLSKMDLLPDDAERRAMLESVRQLLGKPVRSLSAVTGWGLAELLEACWQQAKAQD